MEVVHKIGRRKTAVARVYLSEGKGNITINKRGIKGLLYHCSHCSIQGKTTFCLDRILKILTMLR